MLPAVLYELTNLLTYLLTELPETKFKGQGFEKLQPKQLKAYRQ